MGVALTGAATAQEIRARGDRVETVGKNTPGLAVGTAAGGAVLGSAVLAGAPVIVPVAAAVVVGYGAGKAAEWAVRKLFG